MCHSAQWTCQPAAPDQLFSVIGIAGRSTVRIWPPLRTCCRSASALPPSRTITLAEYVTVHTARANTQPLTSYGLWHCRVPYCLAPTALQDLLPLGHSRSTIRYHHPHGCPTVHTARPDMQLLTSYCMCFALQGALPPGATHPAGPAAAQPQQFYHHVPTPSWMCHS